MKGPRCAPNTISINIFNYSWRTNTTPLLHENLVLGVFKKFFFFKQKIY